VLHLSKGAVALVEEPQLVYLPLWREALVTPLEYAKLRASRVYYGVGVPRGDKGPVIVVPGFLGCDLYLVELNLWLRRMGYRAYMSRIGHNAECPEILCERLLRTLDRAYQRTGRRVHLIGHSLGGVLARGAACLMPDHTASVMTLATPFRGVRINPFVGKALEFVRRRIARRGECPDEDCFTATCGCEFPRVMQRTWPRQVHQTAVYTKQDGVVDWKTCINGDAETDVEVDGTHTGLVWNAHVYRVIAHHLTDAKRAEARRGKVRAKRRRTPPRAEKGLPQRVRAPGGPARGRGRGRSKPATRSAK